MTKRKAEDTDTNTHSIKRIMVSEAHKMIATRFDDLNSDCLVNVLSCLSSDDMNSVAVCSKIGREARDNDSLDQTRSGTIVCTENTTLESIRNAFVRQKWNEVFTGHRTRLKVVGLDTVPLLKRAMGPSLVGLETVPLLKRAMGPSPNHVLPRVSSLDVSFTSLSSKETLVAFVIMLPNLEEIDLSYSSNVPENCIRVIGLEYPNIHRVIWTGSDKDIRLDGIGLPRASTEASLDNSQFYTAKPEVYSCDLENSFLFQLCNRLERLSILNVT